MKSYLRFLVLCLSASLLVACGGGDSTPPPPTETTITGTVSGPSGLIAQLENKTFYARAMDILFSPAHAAITGTAPVPGAIVELIAIDEAGNQVGAVIATVTAGTDGTFSITTTSTPGTNLVLRVQSASVPGVEIRAFATGTTVDINPTSELVTQKVINTVANVTGALLSHFTSDEIQALLDFVNALNLDIADTTIANALVALDIAAGATFDDSVRDRVAVDFSGIWDVVSTVQATTCLLDIAVNYSTVTVVQDGINITIYLTVGTLNGTVLNNVVTWSDTYSDPPGSTSETGSVTVSANGLSAAGTTTWTYTETGFSCTVTESIVATKQ